MLSFFFLIWCAIIMTYITFHLCMWRFYLDHAYTVYRQIYILYTYFTDPCSRTCLWNVSRRKVFPWTWKIQTRALDQRNRNETGSKSHVKPGLGSWSAHVHRQVTVEIIFLLYNSIWVHRGYCRVFVTKYVIFFIFLIQVVDSLNRNCIFCWQR